MEFRFNDKAYYKPYSKHTEKTTAKDLTEANIVVRDDGQSYDYFKIKLRDDFLNLHTYQYFKQGDIYTPSGADYKTSRSSRNFQHNPMGLWEVQLNFAVHCATSALGISTQHFNAKQPMIRSLYRFHAYYHIRRILKRIGAPLPSEHGFDKYNNDYDLAQVNKIGDEYGSSTKSLFLYRNDTYFERTGTSSSGYDYAHNNWSRWIMNSSQGFTKHGLEKISESIRAFTYLILTSQVAARHSIIGDTAPAISAQRIFYDNLNDVISKEVSIEADIDRYQKVLKYARSNLNYSVGSHLYMLPANMILKPLDNIIKDYNDEIVISTSDILGFQAPKPHKKVLPPNHVNTKKALYEQVKKANKSDLKNILPTRDSVQANHSSYHNGKTVLPSNSEFHGKHSTAEEHEEEKEALILGIVSLAIFSFWFFK